MNLLPSRSQWRSWSLPSKLTAVGTLLAIISLGLYGIDKSFYLKDWVINRILESQYAKVPNITLKLRNSGEKIMSVYSEGEFVLWLPQGVYDGVQTIPGRYRIIANSIDGLITIQPAKDIMLAVQLMNPQYFSRVLERGDTDLSLILRRSDGSVIFSENIPFRRDAIEKYYLTADAGKLK